LHVLLTALPRLTTETALAVRILPLTAVRKNELLAARLMWPQWVRWPSLSFSDVYGLLKDEEY
jgi:hypothetical protein